MVEFLVATEFREAGAGLRLLDDIDENMGFLTAIDRFDKCGANAWDNFGVATLPDAPEDAAAFEYQGAVSWDTLNEFSVGDENVPSEVRSYESEADMWVPFGHFYAGNANRYVDWTHITSGYTPTFQFCHHPSVLLQSIAREQELSSEMNGCPPLLSPSLSLLFWHLSHSLMIRMLAVLSRPGTAASKHINMPTQLSQHGTMKARCWTPPSTRKTRFPTAQVAVTALPSIPICLWTWKETLL